jgi:hypothetical protein
MHPWIRLLVAYEPNPEPWHLQLGVSPGGLRVAHCGVSYAHDDELETRPFADPPPSSDTCETCHVAFRRMPR